MGPPSLLLLLRLPPRLSALHCWGCRQVSSAARDQLRAVIGQNNFDVNFQWSQESDELFQDEEENDMRNLLLPLVGINILQDVE